MDQYYLMQDKIEKLKFKRVLQAFIIETILIFIILGCTNKANSTEDFIWYLIGSMFLAAFSLLIHSYIFQFTLFKNYKDSIKLENMFNDLNKK